MYTHTHTHIHTQELKQVIAAQASGQPIDQQAHNKVQENTFYKRTHSIREHIL